MDSTFTTKKPVVKFSNIVILLVIITLITLWDVKVKQVSADAEYYYLNGEYVSGGTVDLHLYLFTYDEEHKRVYMR